MPITQPSGYNRRRPAITPNVLTDPGPNSHNPRGGFGGGTPNLSIDYRGGQRGVDSDFGMRDQFGSGYLDAYFNGQLNMQNANINSAMNRQNFNMGMMGQAAGMMTNADKQTGLNTMRGGIGEINSGIGQFDKSNAFYSNLMKNGMYSPEQKAQILGNMYQQANRVGQVQGENINNAQAARGLGANVLAGQAARQRSAMDAAGMRGDASAQLEREQAQSKITGAQGHSGNASQIAQLRSALASLMGNIGQSEMAPTREGVLGMLGDPSLQGYLDTDFSGMAPDFSGAQGIYDQIRNAPVGPGVGLQPPGQFNPGTGYGGGTYARGNAYTTPYWRGPR